MLPRYVNLSTAASFCPFTVTVAKIQVPELVKVDLRLSLKASQVEQLAVRSVSDVHAWVGVLEIFCHHGCEHHRKMYGAELRFNDLRFNDIPGLTMGILFPERKIFPGITIKSI